MSIKVPDKSLLVITEHPMYNSSVPAILQPLQGMKKRDWFVKHAYFCLPLVIGNQYGIAIRSTKTFEATWNGGDKKEDVEFNMIDESCITEFGYDPQIIKPHFGMGTITIQNRFHFRTPPGVNLMTINPPNFWIDGVQHMTGVVETDNLRRDFTFNLKLTRPGHTVRVNKGDFIGCILPIPRYFADQFVMYLGEEMLTPEQLAEEAAMREKFQYEREHVDPAKPHRNGRRYFNGEDADGNKFPDHQKRVKPYYDLYQERVNGTTDQSPDE